LLGGEGQREEKVQARQVLKRRKLLRTVKLRVQGKKTTHGGGELEEQRRQRETTIPHCKLADTARAISFFRNSPAYLQLLAPSLLTILPCRKKRMHAGGE